MKNQKKQLVSMVISLVFLLVAYLGIDIYNEKLAETEEKEKIYLTNFDRQDICAFSYDYEDMTYCYTKTDTIWTYDGDISLDMDELAIDTLLADVEQILATEAITEYESLATYGLDVPEKIISFTFTDGRVLTIKIGDYHEMLNTYYIMIEGDNTLYLADSTLKDVFEVTDEDLTYVEEVTETESETEELETVFETESEVVE